MYLRYTIALMVIIHTIDEFFCSLFSESKDINLETLKEKLMDYYSYGPFRPKVEIKDRLATIELDMKTITEQQPEYQKAVRFCDKGKFRDAKPILEKLISQNPTNSEYYRILGQIYSVEGNQDKAIDFLIDALKWNPKNDYALIMVGNIYARSKDDIATAMKYYDRVLSINPDNYIAINNIGANMAGLGKFDEALKYLDKAYHINPGYPNTIYGLALVNLNKGNLLRAFDYSIECIKQASKQATL